ncbi:MAG: ATP-binding protein [Thermodesulfovibrionales bacterium]|nr:ATP-binding protein [Thermodesulfovibrionales bacterium]
MRKTVKVKKYAVPIEKLRWVCSQDIFAFECTSDIEPLKEFIGQTRAIDSIKFGLAVERSGYNLFLTGLTGTGKAATIKAHLERFIAGKQGKGMRYELHDWCYVYNFSEPDQPRILRMPQGMARTFSSNLDALLKKLREEIPKTFGSEEYNKRKQNVMQDHQKRYQEAIDVLEQEAARNSLMVQLSPMGAAVVPLADGKPLPREEFLAKPESEREPIEAKRLEIMRKVEETYSRLRDLEKEVGEKMKEIEQKAGEFAVANPFEEIFNQYREHPDIMDFLTQLKEYTLSRLDLFLQAQPTAQMPSIPPALQTDAIMAYKVNIFIDNSSLNGPPIVIEPNPNWFNIFGKIERKAFMGTYVSDHTMIKSGAVQKANGGYLILNIRDVLINQGVWEGLKRVIRAKEVRVEDPWEQLGFLAPQGMKAQPMPVEFKIIVMGDDTLYQMLTLYDEDFWEMFKVKSDFDSHMERSDENMRSFACFIRTCCDDEKLKPFDRSGVAKVIEYAVRSTGDQERLSARFGPLKDLLVEADYWAREANREMISGEDVEKAAREKVHRLDLVAERMRQMIIDGTLMIDVKGAVTGQVNGLSVYDLGIFSFGHPNRITAKTFLGRRGVINIERESQMSGRIHDKGVLILSGYLGWKYAQNKPLSLSASICFEQSYSGVEGDSASSTELYAIMSSLSGLPIRQDIAVTGSVNQKGEVQPIGGVNQKIEGFFDICTAKGLTGKQGVMIPSLNARHLMLREDVVEAVKAGTFHLYEVKTVDQGIEILTGVPAGERQSDGTFPEGTVNALMDKRLRDYAERMRGYMTSPSETF